MQLVLSNPEAAAGDAAVEVSVYDSEGRPVRGFFDSGSSFEIPALGSRVLRSAGSGATRRDWIEVEADSTSVSGLLTYRHAQSGVEIGVQPVELGNQFALFVEESSDIGTGLAIFKPESEPAIELRIRDEEGEDPLDGVFIPHEGFHQRALTMPGWFGVEGVDTGFLRDFRGLLFLRSADGSLFAPLGLRFGKRTASLSAVPVIRGGDVSGGMPPSGTGGVPPTVSLSASPTSIERGQSATLRWSSTNATSASITPGIGTVPASGSRRVSPTRTTTYQITVRSADGQTASASTTVTVTEPPPGDDHSNTRSGATSLVLGSSRSGRIETGSDVDYFRMLVAESGTLTVYTTGNLDTTGELQIGSGSRLDDNDDGGDGSNFRIEHEVSSGTYYVKVGSLDRSSRLRDKITP